MKMNPRIILALIFIPVAFVLAFAPSKTNRPFKLTASELLEEVNSSVQYKYPDEIADRLVQQDPFLILVDVRSPEEFEKFSLPGAINIPLPQLLSDENLAMISQPDFMHVFYSNGTVTAAEAWMITRQLGYENNYVLMGGLNYWAEVIMNPEKPASTSPDDEIAKYDFRKGASMVLGGGVEASAGQSSIINTPKPPVASGSNKKKRVAGGC